MSNYTHGHDAEKMAARYLEQQGYKILALNWHRPRAEIDIVAQQKHGPVVFVEVKYRERMAQGSGFDYITPRKLTQMQFAAHLWVAENRYDGEYVLAALEMGGPEFAVTGFVPEL